MSGRSTQLTTVLEELYKTVQEWINIEIEDGLLSDVQDFITTMQNERPLNTPSIWMQKHNWKPLKKEAINKNSLIIVQFPIEFDCIEFSNDLEDGEMRANNLVGRVIDSILKHYTRRTVKGLFKFVGFEIEEGYPNGSININGKQEVIPVAGVLVIFNVQFMWNNCLIANDDNLVVEDVTRTEVKPETKTENKEIDNVEDILFKENILKE